MAKPKKGALAQILVPMVDATDFASVESAITESDFNSGATRKFYGYNQGVSTATTSGSISKTASLVRSGVFRLTLKGTENNYDRMMVRVSKTGCAEQIYEWENVDNDDSDIVSVLTVIQSMASDAASAAQQANSRVLLNLSRISDIASVLSNLDSNFDSRVPKEVAARSQLSDLMSDAVSDLRSFIGAGVPLDASTMSDLRSAIAAVTATVTASDMSDIASRVAVVLASDLSDILSAAQQTNSRVLLTQSRVSDIASVLSNLDSNFDSRVPKEVAARSQLSDLVSDAVSDLKSFIGAGVPLDASTMSDIRSAIGAVSVTITASDISDIASAVVAALPITSQVSDIYSLLSDLNSQFLSRVPKEVAARSQLSDLVSDAVSDLKSSIGAGVPLDASTMSDLRSAIAAITVTVTASDMSDIASRVAVVLASDLSDILSAAQQTNSRVLVAQSRVSDIASVLSNLDSNFDSRVPKEVAARSQLSDLVSDAVSDLRSLLGAGVSLDASTLSDLRSAIAAIEFDASDVSDIASRVTAVLASDLSDILSAAQQANSRVLVNQSRISDVYSLLSDLHSDLGVLSGVVSDVYSAVNAGLTLSASDLSDIRSAIAANGVLREGSDPAAVVGVTATLAAKVDWLTAMSRNKITQTATKQSLRNDADAATVASCTVSDDGTTATRGEFA